ncbi:cyclophilin-like fold protein [Halochromatium roseum]|uniref:cyclophilin-like fold protein n=1 Tax=Halochromatium roseum TaxID=391920 RepID=UPI0030843D84
MASLLAALLSGPAPAETPHTSSPEGTAMTRIQLIVGGETLSATLDDTPAGRDFAALLPLELSLTDYHATEKIADLPRTLDTRGAPAKYAPSAGDITYYAPWGNLAIFYKPFQSSRGLVRLGAFDGPIDALLRDGAIAVRIEAAE